MTIQATFPTLTLTVLLLTASWNLAADEHETANQGQATTLETEYLLPAGAKAPLPIELVAAQIAADPMWGLRSFQEEDAPSTPARPQETSASETAQDPGYQLMDADGDPLQLSEDEILEFLREAGIVSRKRIGVGVNGVDKILLEKDGVRIYAAFRDVSIRKHEETLATGTVRHFRDDCMRELAAYRVSRLLGLDFLPPVVERKIRRQKGTLQVWVEGITEKERTEKKLRRPSRWFNQRQTMHLFDNLIYNPDRHLANMIFGADGNLWAIDHTRSFWRNGRAVDLDSLRRVERTLWTNLKTLDKAAATAALKEILGPAEIEAFFERHQMVIDHLQKRIDARGEGVVLYGEPESQESGSRNS